MVTNEDEPATLTLSNRQPVDGVSIMATLTDEDSTQANGIDLTDREWQWARGSSLDRFLHRHRGNNADANANGAKTDTYTPWSGSDIGQLPTLDGGLHRRRGLREGGAGGFGLQGVGHPGVRMQRL